MINFSEIPHDSDLWELFARDFLTETGFHIESPPDRGADLGKDMLVSEEISGRVYKGRFRWLVSCKHFSQSGRSVNETDDERNILERLGSFKASGFIGFYSTLASAGLNTRLRQLREEGKIGDYRIFDHKLIENYLLTVGYSGLMIRYFPDSYKEVKPLHLIGNKYQPLPCNYCGKDLLVEMFTRDYSANMVQVYKRDPKTNQVQIKDVYVACKEGCDRTIEASAAAQGLLTLWTDISDMVIPIEYLRSLFAIMNRLRSGADVYTDSAWKKQREVLVAIAQKVLRYTTERERSRFEELLSIL